MTRSDTLWPYEEHTAAKHRLLVRYLQAWFPIMAAQNRALNVIDGFAGPGEYVHGEKGSPILMLEALLNHGNPTKDMKECTVSFNFIEVETERVRHLQAKLAEIELPANAHVETFCGSFDEVMRRVLDAMPNDRGLAPTFAFIDPFGYTGHSLSLSSRILQFQKCEVLIYLPLPFIARFVGEASVEPALNNLFGDESWKEARGYKGRDAALVLHRLFLERLRRAAGRALSFEIDASPKRGWSGYTLYFGTSHLTGLDRMKEAMWSVDPSGGSRFAYSVDPDQLTMFVQEPNLRELEAALRDRFTGQFSVEQAARFTTLETPFAPRIHLKRKTLEVAERAGRLKAWHPTKPKRRVGQYPDGTLMRFVGGEG